MKLALLFTKHSCMVKLPFTHGSVENLRYVVRVGEFPLYNYQFNCHWYSVQQYYYLSLYIFTSFTVPCLNFISKQTESTSARLVENLIYGVYSSHTWQIIYGMTQHQILLFLFSVGTAEEDSPATFLTIVVVNSETID
jgi:hypothetical protein